MGKKSNLTAIALCLVFIAAMAGIYMYERAEQQYNLKIYQRVIPEREKRQAEIERRKQELAERREQARLDYLAAAEEYLPGIAFFGDSLVGDTDGGGMDFRSTVGSLVRSGVCNAATAYIDTRKSVGFQNVSSFLPIVFVGAETKLSDADALLAKQRRYISGHDRYIIVGATTGSRDDMNYLEYVMTNAYGDRFINIREYMSTDGLASLELEITSDDQRAMDQGRIPPSFLRADGVHLNDNGVRLLSYLTYDRMMELGYFDEIIEAKNLYSEAENAEIDAR